MPLSELLAEMACPSLEENTELSEPDEQQSVKQHSVDYDSVEQRMDHLPGIDVPRSLINDLWVFLFQKIDAECIK